MEPSVMSSNGTNRARLSALAPERAKQKRDFAIFSTAAKIIVSGNWWSLQSGGAFVFCTSFHAGLSTFSLGCYFRPHQVDPQVAILCGLCPSSPRGGEFLLKLVEALDRGVFTYFTNHVLKFAGVPACPRLKAVSNATWWGYLEALFCEECFLEFVADTTLGLSLPFSQETLEDMQICQIWSDRMRALWLQVCAAGEPGSTESADAVQNFRLIGAQRQQVYRETILEIEAAKELQEAKQQEVAFFSQMYVKWSGTAGLRHVQQSMNGDYEGIIYGSSSLGYFDTHAGAEAQKFLNKMNPTIAELNMLVSLAKVSRLKEQWNEVE
ncbi:hypothetical protein IL306_007057 [Fusarium sp. DS 682]|nr:hypothetical protein IL306_007057 [Fusarium sp. DS 682]